MPFHYQVQDVPDAAGRPSGTYRLAVFSDSGDGGPFSDPSHSHLTPEDVDGCERCRDYCDGIVSAAEADAHQPAPATPEAPAVGAGETGPAAEKAPAEVTPADGSGSSADAGAAPANPAPNDPAASADPAAPADANPPADADADAAPADAATPSTSKRKRT